jgi:uncharacterized protein (TIGR03435 family)
MQQKGLAHFSAQHVSVENLISWAYYTKNNDQIVAGPSWVRTDFFDVQAKVSETDIEAINKLGQAERIEQSRLLVQSLLADRFHLQVSFKTQEIPVYAQKTAAKRRGTFATKGTYIRLTDVSFSRPENQQLASFVIAPAGAEREFS